MERVHFLSEFSADLIKGSTPANTPVPPDFLLSLMAMTNLMRLSLLKTAHAVMNEATCRKSGATHAKAPA
jgi:hypothetical protein